VIEHRSHIFGVVGEFETEEHFLDAVRKTREAGYRRFEAYAPFPVEGLSEAMGLKRNNVPLITLMGGCVGGLGGFFFQYWAMAISYPLNIGGRSLNSWPAWIPVTFEMTVLGAALSAVFGMLALNHLPQPHHALFNVHRFAKHATSDRFFLSIEARDPKFHLKDTARFLQDLRALHVTEVEDD
jgi:Protein of unknown function (DUF3341)